VKNWFAGADQADTTSPRSPAIRMSLAAFLALSGRHNIAAGAKLFNVRNRIAAMWTRSMGSEPREILVG
jgi:hypothetical protein